MKAKYLYLIDTCAWVTYYRGDEKTKKWIDYVIEQKGLNRATLFMPSFCIAEVFNTFAKWRYREGLRLSEDEYVEIKNKFRDHIRKGALITEYPLHIYHIYNTDYVIPFEHQLEPEQDTLSTFDILIIGMGIELVKHYGDFPIRILTADKRIAWLSEKLRGVVNDGIRKKYGIPNNIIYPQAVYLPTCEKTSLPYVKGQYF